MASEAKITTLFLDVGGVLLTNGWDRKARYLAVKKFKLDLEEINERHHLTFDTYEAGKLNLNEYLDRVVFYEKRNFTKEDFENFMFTQSNALPKMIDFINSLKKKFNLKVTAVSNEGRELTEYRIKQFKLNEIFDSFVASSFVHFRKPDVDIYKIALDISQVMPQQVAYLDDRLMFVQVARSLGIKGIHHKSLSSTREQLAKLGLTL
ncbi:MAG TPA: HAD-IA family hydrolase [Ignavibacteriaceae bacterium]|nr:HAD-IA family hydrolase [Ignavibacteriaceae bacterium]